ncbi:cyclase family protein [Kineococcus sp. SYSU DK006]|uniref:cyclase family protein n=1 Tax=Kineococcus sp. SYSU DK006 TaxID=3383127 RepID=UPI003D7E6258
MRSGAAGGAGRLVDLSRPVGPGTPVLPGDPAFAAEPALTLEREGVRVARLVLGTHTGTHVDAPAHVHPDGATLDELPLELFCGPAAVIGVEGVERIGPEHLAAAAGAATVLLRTGWDTRAGTAEEFAHPFLTGAGARALRAAGVRTVGIDTASVDAPGRLEAHRVLLGTRADPGVLVENLRGLAGLPAEVGFSAFGWALRGGDGSPVRAVAHVPG